MFKDENIYCWFSFKWKINTCIKRWIKQRLGIEKCSYNPRYEMLKSMLQWSKDYDLGKDKLMNNHK